MHALHCPGLTQPRLCCRRPRCLHRVPACALQGRLELGQWAVMNLSMQDRGLLKAADASTAQPGMYVWPH